MMLAVLGTTGLVVVFVGASLGVWRAIAASGSEVGPDLVGGHGLRVFGIPETFFIDANGVIVGKIIGESDAFIPGCDHRCDQVWRLRASGAAG